MPFTEWVIYENKGSETGSCMYYDSSGNLLFRVYNLIFKNDPTIVFFPHPERPAKNKYIVDYWQNKMSK